MTSIPKIRGDVPPALDFIGAVVTFGGDFIKRSADVGAFERLSIPINASTEFVHCNSYSLSHGASGIYRTAIFLPRTVVECNKDRLESLYNRQDGSIFLYSSKYVDRFADVKIKVQGNIWDCLDGCFGVPEEPNKSIRIPQLRRKVFIDAASEVAGVTQKSIHGLKLVSSNEGLIPSLAWEHAAKPGEKPRREWHPYDAELRKSLRFTRSKKGFGEPSSAK